jgi:protein phosphatase
VVVRPELGLFAVADGAGGHNAGDVAARLACDTIEAYFEKSVLEEAKQPAFDRFGIATAARRLSTSVHRANKAVVNLSRSSQKHKGMGTTIVVLSYARATAMMHVAHVGDSRCYRLRQGCLERLTEDHSLLTDVLEISPRK